MTNELDALCDRILELPIMNRTFDRFSWLLGIPMTEKPAVDAMRYAEGAFTRGPLLGADLRQNKETGLVFLALSTRPGHAPKATALDLRRFGAAVSYDVNPHIPPGGTKTSVYLARGARISFETSAGTEELRTISFEWPGRDGGSTT